MNILVITFFLAFLSVAKSAIMPCSAEKGGMPKAVSVDDCDANEQRCSFVRGKSFKADVTFTALTDLSSLTPRVDVTVGGVKIETQLPDDRYQACDWLLEGAQSCPIPRGKDSTWRLNIPVVLTDPLVPVKLEISLFGTDGQPQFCFIVLGQIVAF